MVGSGTNIAEYTGVDAIRGQSLEGAGKDARTSDIVQAIIFGILDRTIPPTRTGVIEFLKNNNINSDQERETIFKEFQDRVSGIVKKAQSAIYEN
jgi:hypothetical protein